MLATALAGGAVMASPASAWAQGAMAAQQKSADYNIPAQDLTGALRQFAEVSGLQLIYDTKITADKRSPGATGGMTAQAALARILAGSGLGYSLSGSAVTIVPAGDSGPMAAGPRVLAPVRVQGDDTAGSPVNGVNGSRDVTATEGTDSYTSGALDIVSKIPQSIKDTPQTVSVITSQQIADENLNDLATALAQAPGITVINTSGLGYNQQTAFYSRGFPITTLQIDGGAPLDMQYQYGFSPVIDMSEYDSLQIIRGADGLFGGYGSPSGVVDLVRKKPLDHDQFTSDTQIGSWNDYRETVDVTGPLTPDKNLKGRLVFSYQDNDYFYKIAHNNQYHIYGNLEYDLGRDTTINVGGSYAQERQIPNASGIPVYTNGEAAPLPTSTCLCFPWSRDNTITTEAFVQLNHKFNKDWGIKLDFTYENQSQYYNGGAVISAYPPLTPTNPIGEASAAFAEFTNQQFIGDFTLNGAFQLFGHEQYIVVGASYQHEGGPYNQYNPLTFAPNTMPNTNPPANIFSFNPNDPAYAQAGGISAYLEAPRNGQDQYTAYSNAKITLLDPLHLIVGFRFSGYSEHYVSNSICQASYIPFLCTTVGATIPAFAIYQNYGDNHFSLPPDASLIYDVTKDISVYASYTDIYQSNSSVLEVDDKTPLPPETGYNDEIGIKWQRPDKKLNVSFDIYNIDLINFPISLGSGTLPDFGKSPDGAYCCYTTGGSEHSRGVDFEIAGEITKGWNFSGSYSYDFTENRETKYNDGTPTYSQQPRNLVKLFTTYKFQSDSWLKNLSVGGGFNYQTKTYVVAYQFFNEQKDYGLLNLRADYQISKHWNMGLNVTNATNVKYFTTLGLAGGGQFYGQPAAYTLDLKANF